MSRQIRLLADQGIPLEKNRLPSAISLTRYDSAGGIPKTVDQYDALFVRTVSPVDKTTIPAHPVHLRFIGSATAGVDHVDREWLDENGIGFSYAPGCNGRAVGEYAGTAAVIWSLLTDNILSGLTAGIVGAGSTGTAVAKQFARLGISCKMHDPPREEREAGFKSVPVDDILECDLLSFHTPLIKNGARPTYHWLNGQKLDNRRFRLIINAARGGIINEQALLQARQKGSVENFILDVWENEPLFNDTVAENAFLTTPHIAGYSLQAKQRASEMVTASLCSFFDLPSPRENVTAEAGEPVRPTAAGLQPDLLRTLTGLNPIGEYDREFKSMIGMAPEEKSRTFQKIRTGYPLRHEHSRYRLDPAVVLKYPVLKSLGFHSE